MTRFSLAFLLALAASPALAYNECDDLWLSRNHAYALAGHCFASTLGQSFFATGTCTADAAPGATGMKLVAMAPTREKELSCAVDTTRSVLDVNNLDLRLKLEVPVVRSEFASGCLGWKGPETDLLAGPRHGSEVLGTLQPGDDVVWEYDYVGVPDAWQFITVYHESAQITLGWMKGAFDPALCTSTAG